MVNNVVLARPGAVSALIRTYLAVVLGTVAALVVLAAAAPRLATDEAWGHAVIVAVFAVLLLVRGRAARAGRPEAIRAVRIIAAVLLVVNVVEAALPVFPAWMRIEMVGIALLMLALVLNTTTATPSADRHQGQ
jgi:hypothetical protein